MRTMNYKNQTLKELYSSYDYSSYNRIVSIVYGIRIEQNKNYSSRIVRVVLIVHIRTMNLCGSSELSAEFLSAQESSH